MSKERISTTQLMMLVLISRVTVALVYFPLMENPDLKQDAWIAALFGPLLGIPAVWLLSRLWLRFPDMTFVQVAEEVLGKVLGKAVVLIYLLATLLAASTNLRLTGEFFLFAFLPRTPLIVVIAIVGLLSIYSVRAGLEVLGRLGQIIFPLVVGFVFLICLLLVKDIDFRTLQPVFVQTGPAPLIREMVVVVARNTEYVWIAMTIPFLNQPRAIFRSVTIAHLWQALIMFLMAFTVTGLLRPVQSLLYFPFFSAASQVMVADFLERIDAVVLSVWLFGMFLRIALFLWAACMATAHLAGLKEYRPLVVPLGGIAVTYAITQADSFSQVRDFLDPESFAPLTLTLFLVIPMLVLAVAAARGISRSGAR